MSLTEMWSASKAWRRPSVQASTAVPASALFEHEQCLRTGRPEQGKARQRRHTRENAKMRVAWSERGEAGGGRSATFYQDYANSDPRGRVYQDEQEDDGDGGRGQGANDGNLLMDMMASAGKILQEALRCLFLSLVRWAQQCIRRGSSGLSVHLMKVCVQCSANGTWLLSCKLYSIVRACCQLI